MIKKVESEQKLESSETNSRANQQSVFMGSALVVLNLFLMSCVGVYWTNTSVHQFFSGRPL